MKTIKDHNDKYTGKRSNPTISGNFGTINK